MGWGIGNIFKGVVNAIVSVAKAIVNVIKQVVSAIVNAIVAIAKWIASAVKAIWDWFTDLIGDFGSRYGMVRTSRFLALIAASVISCCLPWEGSRAVVVHAPSDSWCREVQSAWQGSRSRCYRGDYWRDRHQAGEPLARPVRLVRPQF